MLVTTGGGGKTLPCTICHGPDLKGVGDIPPIAGRSPMSYMRSLCRRLSAARPLGPPAPRRRRGAV
jgi:hypothetical protein